MDVEEITQCLNEHLKQVKAGRTRQKDLHLNDWSLLLVVVLCVLVILIIVIIVAVAVYIYLQYSSIAPLLSLLR